MSAPAPVSATSATSTAYAQYAILRSLFPVVAVLAATRPAPKRAQR